MTRFLKLLVVALAVAQLAGCSQTTARPSAGPVQLQTSDNGKTVQLSPGDVVKVKLESNVTTGYSWALSGLDSKLVEKTSQEYIAPATSAVGAGGVEVWTFTAKAPGTTPLRLEYRRPWEKDAKPAKVFTATFNVR